jgi:hypothetical protein
MSKLRLTFACGPYDRTAALRDGTLQPEGIDLVQPAEIFWRMLQYQEFNACEMSLSNTTTLVSEGNAPFIVARLDAVFVFQEPAHVDGRRHGQRIYARTAQSAQPQA